MINVDFKSALEVLKAFPDEETCLTHLEKLRWNGTVISPFNPISKVYVCKNNRFRCSFTGKYFNAKTGTIFHNSKIELQKWFLAIWIVTFNKKGITSVELAKDLGITQKTSWYMLQRIKKYYGLKDEKVLPEKRIPKAKEIKIIEAIEVVEEKEKLPMTVWLQLLKK